MMNACGARAARPSIRTTRWRDGWARTTPRVVASQHAGDEKPALVSRRTAGLCTVGLGPALSLAGRADALTAAELQPPRVPALGALSPLEQSTVSLFERSTYGVVNIVDVTIRTVYGGASVEVPEGNGTGFVWDDQGHVVTNYHVLASVLGTNVPGRKTVAKVTLLGADGYSQVFDATLVGTYKPKDLAVVKIDAAPSLLRPLSLGDSSGVKVGQTGYAIGNPFGFDHTLTIGVVSGLDRQIESQVGSTITGGIQTDAAINPGNSGGPLLDSMGNVVGINTAIFTRSGFSSGIGFAIPINTARRIVPQLIANGVVSLPSLNVQLASAKVAKQLAVPAGALIQAVAPGSAAAQAGLLPTRRGLSGIVVGDVVVAVDGVPIKDAAALDDAVQARAVGDRVTLKVSRRDGSKEELKELVVVLQEQIG